MGEKQVKRETIRQSIAEEAAVWDVTDTGEMMGEGGWFTFEWTESEDRCARCGGSMDLRRIDLHLAGGRVILRGVAWYVCSTPKCGYTKLPPGIETLVQEIEASVARAVIAHQTTLQPA